MALSFKVTRTDAALIRRIAARAIASLQALSAEGRCALDLQMDLTACHANGCPLDLAALLGSGDVSFAHDVCGIARHLNRSTDRLTGHFLPRYALPLRGPGKRAAAAQRASLNRRAAALLSQGA